MTTGVDAGKGDAPATTLAGGMLVLRKTKGEEKRRRKAAACGRRCGARAWVWAVCAENSDGRERERQGDKGVNEAGVVGGVGTGRYAGVTAKINVGRLDLKARRL